MVIKLCVVTKCETTKGMTTECVGIKCLTAEGMITKCVAVYCNNMLSVRTILWQSRDSHV